MKRLLPFGYAALLCLLTTSTLAQPAQHPGPASGTLEFIENKGQWDAPARYAAPLPGGQLFAEADGLTFALLANGGPAQHRHDGQPISPNVDNSIVRGHAFSLRFAGASAAALTAETPTAEHRNYFLGADASRWARDVRSYRALHYAGLWPGVSARVYESADQHLEYDFVLAPGANPSAIGLRHEGADGVALDAAGNLLVTTSVGTVTERAPQAWQTAADGERVAVACRYVLAGPLVRFALGPYDTKRPLTIDPVVVFATYTGSTANNWGFTATYDNAGNLYSGGIVFGLGYPTSPGAFQTTFAGMIDIAIIKFNTAANGPAARVWATYLGGSSTDYPHSLVVNNQGELLVLGSSGSNNYPTTSGALQSRYGGGRPADPLGYGASNYMPNGSDLVVTRLAANGAALVGSTYLGGSNNDGILPLVPSLSSNAPVPQLARNYGDPFRGDIIVDAADNVYIASHTSSSDFPMAGGFNSTYRGGSSDAVVCKLTPTLTAMTWGSYLGGSGADAAYSIQLEPTSGDVYVAGGTLSDNFPVTTGAYQTTRPGRVDGFAARIAATGTVLRRATYVGTASYDQAYFVQLGTDGGVYLLGQSTGPFPVTPGLYATPNGTQFIQKLDPNLSTRLLSTTFGSNNSFEVGTTNLSPTAFLVDRCDRIYVSGWGGELNRENSYQLGNGTTFGLPTTPDALQTTTDGSDFYLAQFAADLTGLAYGTYYGNTNRDAAAEHVDGGTSRFDSRGIVYQAVCSCFSRTGFPIPPGANTYSTTNNSGSISPGCNNAAFVLDFQPSSAAAGADQTVCTTTAAFPLVGTPAGGLWTGPGVTGNQAQGYVFTPSPALLGVNTLTYTVVRTGGCTTTDTRLITVVSPPEVTFAPVGPGVFCRPLTGPALPAIPLVASPVGGTFSGPGVTNARFDPMLAGPGLHTITYTYTVGCTVTKTQLVRVTFVGAGPDQVACSSAAPISLRGSPTGGTWSGPGVSGSPAEGYVFTPATGLVGANTLTYSLTTSNPLSTASCTAASTLVLTVVLRPTISLTPLPPLCAAITTPQALTATPAGGTWAGPGVSGSVGLGYFFTPSIGVGTYQLQYSAGTALCPVTAVLPVTVFAAVSVTVGVDTALCPGSTQPFRLRASPGGGTWAGPGVTGSAATGYVFTPPLGFVGSSNLVYTVANGACTGTGTRRVFVAPVPALQPAWMPAACPETRLAPLTLRFTLNSTGNSQEIRVLWDFGDGTQSAELNPTHIYATLGVYQPRVRVRYNLDRCETSAMLPVVEVQERKLPNIITPNGDNLNQTFKLGPDCPPRMQVFTRWGQSVFESAAYHDEWSAEGQPDGVYYYLLTYPDGHRIKGWVEVVR
ncbi:gliding motility-associated C-terminal domain-containing protein [Hymenobacter sp. BT664]|uniref:Gliding motility-associated C-terminal domain-containing protein n=1 Tax=Hymenobacter montanus TaxID=2771359 RepID=A0A927BHE3_9BACT|nr:gliding motility-associated C-terminal domain-containing protein [Hymenobacter montanus]MBD2770103.1 gliding motility-associated C-terminal domain-containing protein [Hymenobacter montanus]